MSVTFIDKASGTPSGSQASVSATIAAAQILGDLIVAFVANNATGVDTTSVTDLAGNSYVRQVTRTDNINVSQEVWIAQNCAAIGASSNTVTAVGAANYTFPALHVAVYRGCATASAFDVGVSGSGTGTLADSGNITTTSKGDLLVARGIVSSHFTGPGAPVSYVFTQRDIDPNGDILEDILQAGGNGTYNATGICTNGNWVMSLVAIRRIAPTQASILQDIGGVDPGGGSATTVAINPVIGSGDTAVVSVTWGSSSVTCTVADTIGNTYTPIGSPRVDATDNQSTQQFYAQNSTNGATTLTATFSSSVAFRGVHLTEWENVKLSGVLDGNTSNFQASPGNGTDALTSTGASNSNQPAIVFGMACNADNTEIAPQVGTGFTNISTDWAFPTLGGDSTRFEYKRITATGSQAATFTANGSGTNRYMTHVIILDEIVITAAQTIAWITA